MSEYSYYKVKVDDTYIHDTTKKLKSGSVTENFGSASNFSFVMGYNHENYDIGTPMVSIVTVTEGFGDPPRIVFVGRITEKSYDFENNISYYCEGCLSFLNDILYPPSNVLDPDTIVGASTIIVKPDDENGSGNDGEDDPGGSTVEPGPIIIDDWGEYKDYVQIPRTIDLFRKVIETYNKCRGDDDSLKLNIGTIDLDAYQYNYDLDYREVDSENLQMERDTCYNIIKKYCLDIDGGYLYISEGRTINWVGYPKNNKNDPNVVDPGYETIEYGKNMLSIDQNINASSLHTVYIFKYDYDSGLRKNGERKKNKKGEIIHDYRLVEYTGKEAEGKKLLDTFGKVYKYVDLGFVERKMAWQASLDEDTVIADPDRTESDSEYESRIIYLMEKQFYEENGEYITMSIDMLELYPFSINAYDPFVYPEKPDPEEPNPPDPEEPEEPEVQETDANLEFETLLNVSSRITVYANTWTTIREFTYRNMPDKDCVYIFEGVIPHIVSYSYSSYHLQMESDPINEVFPYARNSNYFCYTGYEGGLNVRYPIEIKAGETVTIKLKMWANKNMTLEYGYTINVIKNIIS